MKWPRITPRLPWSVLRLVIQILARASVSNSFSPAGNGLLLRIRDVYVAYPEGSVEMTFSCNSAEFDKQKLGFMRQLNSFRLLSKDVKTNP